MPGTTLRYERSKRAVLALGWLGLGLGLSLGLGAQNPLPQVDDTTAAPPQTPGHALITGPHETVDPANGQVSLRFAVPLPPGRGVTPVFSFAYDSAGAHNLFWDSGTQKTAEATQQTLLSSNGWSYTIPQLTYSTYTTQPYANLCTVTTGYVYQGADGQRRGLELSVTGFAQIPVPGDTCDGDIGEKTSDGPAGEGGWLATTLPLVDTRYHPVAVTVTDPDGTQIVFPATETPTYGVATSTITDRNGNSLTLSVSGTDNAITYTDTLGRTVLQTSGFAQTEDTITVSGMTTPYTATWAQEGGGTAVPYSGMGGYPCPSGTAELLGGTPAMTSLVTPEGTYTFSYNPTYGLLDQITYPNGGYVQYTWGVPQDGNPNETVSTQYVVSDNPPPEQIAPCGAAYQHPVVVERTVNDGTRVVEQQTFQYSSTWDQGEGQWTSKQTVVTTTDEVAGTSATVTYQYGYGDQPLPWNPLEYEVLPAEMPLESAIATAGGGQTLRTVQEAWTSSYPFRVRSAEGILRDEGWAVILGG